jgi:hypothetical protein
MKKFIALILLLTGCGTVPKEAMPQKFDYYRAEIKFTIGDRSYKGLAVTPFLSTIQITLQSPVALDRLEISSCSRHVVLRDVDSSPGGWWGSSGKTTYFYTPTANESEGNCPIHFQAFSKDVQKAWGMVFIRTDQTLPATLDCNDTAGSHNGWAGISPCQTKAGMDQRISFDVPVQYKASAECQITPVTDSHDTAFKVRSTGGFCKASFSDGKRFNDLVLLGYNQVVVY